MRAITLILISVAMLLGATTSVAQPAYTTRAAYGVIRCESFGTRASFCAADTRRGLRLANDYSGRCRLGQTWGYTARGIWVGGGCRADFALGKGDNYGWGWGYSDTRYVVCASEDYQRKFCPANTSRGVKLVNQISNSACVRGRTWWRDARGIVVTNGCAGEFELAYRDSDYVTPPATGAGGPYRPERFVCSSRGAARRYCPADVGHGAIAMVRRIGIATCVRGRSWDYDREGVWVSHGCSAEFEVGYAEQEWVPEAQVRYVRCESSDYQRNWCDTEGARAVTLQRQLSRALCVEGRTWGMEGNRLWVDDGCGGDFLLQ